MATDNKRILFRRGNESDLKPNDLLPGEPVMALDKNAPGVKGSGGTVVWCATRTGTNKTVPMSQGGLNASNPKDARKNLQLISYVIASGTSWKLLKYGTVMELRIYDASASSIPPIDSLHRPANVNATGFAWLLGDTPQPGALTISAYDGRVKSYAITGPDTSSTECRGTVSWIIG